MSTSLETGGAGNVTQISDGNPNGNTFGQSSTDLISFYNATPIAQPASGDVLTQLANLGLFASASAGSFTMNPTVTTNETGTTLSSVTPLAASGWSKVNTTVAYTYFVANPIKGTEKFFYMDGANTSGITATIALNRTTVLANSSLNFLITPGSTLSSSASSLATIVVTATSISGAGVTLIAASSVEWVLKSVQSTLVTFTT